MILLFALIFLTVVAFTIATLVSQAYGSFASTVALRQVQAVQYSADAAVQEAMSSLAYTTNWVNWPQVTSPPTTVSCPISPGNTNPVIINGLTVYAYCTYLGSLSHNVEITACQSAVVSADCTNSLLRAYVTVSQAGPNPVYVQINDWSVLYQGNS